MPDHAKPFRVESDTSGHAVGSVLSQLGTDDLWHPVAFHSKSLTAVERNYPIHDRELLSVLQSFQEWRHLLEGARHKIEVLNDHRNLQYFMVSQDLNRRQARWSLYLSRFDFVMTHRPGKSSGKPDALSRRADHDLGKDDNKAEVLLGPELLSPESFRIRATGGIALEGAEDALMERVRECDSRDEAVVKGVQRAWSGRRHTSEGRNGRRATVSLPGTVKSTSRAIPNSDAISSSSATTYRARAIRGGGRRRSSSSGIFGGPDSLATSRDTSRDATPAIAPRPFLQNLSAASRPTLFRPSDGRSSLST